MSVYLFVHGITVLYVSVAKETCELITMSVCLFVHALTVLYISVAKETCEFGPCNLSTVCPRPRNVLALCWKNSMRILRNPGILLFQFVLPAIQISLFCWAIGRNLEGINVAVVNQDQGLGEYML